MDELAVKILLVLPDPELLVLHLNRLIVRFLRCAK
jgi:hypothetical protein